MAVKQPRREKPSREKPIRRSISLPKELDRKVQAIAKRQRSSTNRVLESLIDAGIHAKEAEKQRFFAVAEKFRSSVDPNETDAAREELSRLIFGE